MSLKLNGATSGYVEIDAPAVAGSTSITLPATSGGEFVVTDSNGQVGLGTTSPTGALTINADGDATQLIIKRVTTAEDNGLQLQNQVGSTVAFFNVEGTSTNRLQIGGSDEVAFFTGSTFGSPPTNERVRIDNSGRLLVGTSSSSVNASLVLEGNSGDSAGGASIRLAAGTDSPGTNDALGYINFGDNSHNGPAVVAGFRDGGTWSASSKPSRLVFWTTANGTASPTERMRIDSVGRLYVPDVYASTTGAAANVVVESDGRIRRTTSSAKYKTQIETLEDVYSDKLLECRPVWYRSTCEGDNPDFSYWGFIAEEVAEIDPRLVFWKTVEITYDEKGSVVQVPCNPEPEGVQYDRFVPHLLNLIKRQGEAIAELQAEVAALKGA